MKKLVLFFVVVALTMTQLLAQESTFKKGDKVLNLAIGFGSGLYTGGGYTTSVPPLSASFEVGVKDGILEKGSIGVGGVLAYGAHKWEYAGWGWKYTNIIIGARGSFHYPLAKKLDTYTGLILGYNVVTAKEFGTNPIYDTIHNPVALLIPGLLVQGIISATNLQYWVNLVSGFHT
jgi:opacity protein-like surface antigen